MASVALRGLTKHYGGIAVVDDVSLTIEHGLLVCLLGPSGCGKTTTLRLIAGFVEPTAGEIVVGERTVSTPARTAASTMFRAVRTPAVCPADRGMPRACAQRPLPSMMIATCSRCSAVCGPERREGLIGVIETVQRSRVARIRASM